MNNTVSTKAIQPLPSAHINEEQNCLSTSQPPATTEALEQQKNANYSLQKPPQHRFVVTSDLKGAQECFVCLGVTSVWQEETPKNIHFPCALLALKSSKSLTVRGFQECFIPKQVLGWGFLAFPTLPSLQNFQLRIFCDPKGILGSWESQRGAGRAQIQNHGWILGILSPPFSWVLKPPLSHILYLPLPWLLHPGEFLGLAFGFVRVNPASSTHLSLQGGTAALLIYHNPFYWKKDAVSITGSSKERAKRTGSRKIRISPKIILPFIQANCISEREKEKKSGPFPANHSL